MTKAELSQYRSILAEIVENEERIRESTLRDSVRGSCSEFPYTSHTMSIEGIDCSGDNSRLLKRQNELKRRKRRIEDFIDNIPDSETRRIFRYRYIVGNKKPTWMQLTRKMYPKLPIDMRERMRWSLIKKHDRYLEKVVDKKN